MIRFLLFSCFIFLLVNRAVAQGLASSPIKEAGNGYVPDATTAIRIAEAIQLPLYGARIYQRKPFRAVLRNKTVWVVEGTLPKGYDGGVPHLEINKQDGCVIEVYHSK